jgi:pilus assembly protein Flp/PilA
MCDAGLQDLLGPALRHSGGRGRTVLADIATREVTNAVLTTLAGIAARVLPERDEEGQGLAEYALILALIAVVAIIALLYLGSQISDKLSVIGNAM